jgi:hypothetical protein
MSEGLQQWDFVVAAYSVGLFGTTAMIAWSLAAMRRAEKRRDRTRER